MKVYHVTWLNWWKEYRSGWITCNSKKQVREILKRTYKNVSDIKIYIIMDLNKE